MSRIQIADLQATGTELFQGNESFLTLTFPVKFGWPTASPQLDHVI
jgi:hypothetical protein